MYKADAEIWTGGNASHILDGKAQIVAVSFLFLSFSVLGLAFLVTAAPWLGLTEYKRVCLLRVPKG